MPQVVDVISYHVCLLLKVVTRYRCHVIMLVMLSSARTLLMLSCCQVGQGCHVATMTVHVVMLSCCHVVMVYVVASWSCHKLSRCQRCHAVSVVVATIVSVVMLIMLSCCSNACHIVVPFTMLSLSYNMLYRCHM
jgi:hypothetical protein